MFDGAKPSTVAAGLGFDGSHDPYHRRNSMSARRIWKADLSGCLATALVAVLFASSSIAYAQVLKNKPAAPAKSAPAQAAHTAAPAASHPAGGHTAAPTNTGNRGPA